ncbi:MAG TPA: aconitase X [Burkholderiales bacterium]|nr:aconitase X [Burkholderiales bacterium]
MKLNDLEKAMLAGEHGEAARWALELQVRVGEFFDARDFVEVRMVQLSSDIEVVGASGLAFLRRMAALPPAERRLRAFATADARGFDSVAYSRLLPGRDLSGEMDHVVEALVALGAVPTHATANYHSVLPLGYGQHGAFSGTPQVIYANSVQGARCNFEAGPAGIAAMFTGRVPRYGFHLDRARAGTRLFRLEFAPESATDWGAVGAIIGRRTGSYSAVPVIDGVGERPDALALSHLGVALASYGSTGLFHLVGVTPEAPTVEAAFGGRPVPEAEAVTRAALDAFYAAWPGRNAKLDAVVLGAPQLSYRELCELADLLQGRHIHADTLLLAYTAEDVKEMCARQGIVQAIEAAGGMVVHGLCFFQIFAREVREANGWNCLMSQSVKMANLTAGFGYHTVPATLERCVESAIAGRVS